MASHSGGVGSASAELQLNERRLETAPLESDLSGRANTVAMQNLTVGCPLWTNFAVSDLAMNGWKVPQPVPHRWVNGRQLSGRIEEPMNGGFVGEFR
jgi:hypothetical protein